MPKCFYYNATCLLCWFISISVVICLVPCGWCACWTSNVSCLSPTTFIWHRMMESCFYNKLESVEREVNFDDLKKDLFSEFNSIDSQESCLEEHEHLQVYLRIRPFTTTESEKGESQVIELKTAWNPGRGVFINLSTQNNRSFIDRAKHFAGYSEWRWLHIGI